MSKIITLALLFCASVAATDDITYILATVLFYSDINGDMLVASGPVPLKLERIILRDVKMRLSNATVKVVPIFKDPHFAPTVEELFGFVKYAYKHVFVARLPTRTAEKIMADKKIFMKKRNHLVDIKNTKMVSFGVVPDLKGKIKTEVENDIVHEDDGKLDLAELIDSRRESFLERTLDKFLPTSVFYAIENKCVNWRNDCNLSQINFSNLSRKSFKYTFFKHSTEAMSLKQTTVK